MDRLEVGKIVNTHGLKGEVKIVTWTDSPDVFEDLDFVFAKKKKEEIKLTLKSIKYQKNNIIVKFSEINSIDEAEAYKNCVLSADREMLGELPEGVYYIADLIGCDVFDENNNKIGTLTDVFNTGANDIYVVSRPQNKDLLIPVIDETIINVDTENKRIDIKLIEGLDEL
ncbi:MAG: ribosome maturation factor RimM [Clostridia bacterium]|nr:ribosome maturation factor RimM [Clostridia bacterium]